MSDRPSNNDWKIDAKTNYTVQKKPDYNKPTEEYLKKEAVKQKFLNDVKAGVKVYIDPTVDMHV